jgi:hypothetical protein
MKRAAALYVSRLLDDGDVKPLPGSRYVIRAVNGPGGTADADLQLELRSDGARVTFWPRTST